MPLRSNTGVRGRGLGEQEFIKIGPSVLTIPFSFFEIIHSTRRTFLGSSRIMPRHLFQATRKIFIFSIGINHVSKAPSGVAVCAHPMHHPPWRDASFVSSMNHNEIAEPDGLVYGNEMPLCSTAATIVGTSLGTVLRPVVSVSWVAEPNVPIYWALPYATPDQVSTPDDLMSTAHESRYHSGLSGEALPFQPLRATPGNQVSRHHHGGSTLRSPSGESPMVPVSISNRNSSIRDRDIHERRIKGTSKGKNPARQSTRKPPSPYQKSVKPFAPFERSKMPATQGAPPRPSDNLSTQPLDASNRKQLPKKQPSGVSHHEGKHEDPVGMSPSPTKPTQSSAGTGPKSEKVSSSFGVLTREIWNGGAPSLKSVPHQASMQVEVETGGRSLQNMRKAQAPVQNHGGKISDEDEKHAKSFSFSQKLILPSGPHIPDPRTLGLPPFGGGTTTRDDSEKTASKIASFLGITGDSTKLNVIESQELPKSSRSGQIPAEPRPQSLSHPVIKKPNSDREWMVVSKKKGAMRLPRPRSDGLGESDASSSRKLEDSQNQPFSIPGPRGPFQTANAPTTTDPDIIFQEVNNNNSKREKKNPKSDGNPETEVSIPDKSISITKPPNDDHVIGEVRGQITGKVIDQSDHSGSGVIPDKIAREKKPKSKKKKNKPKSKNSGKFPGDSVDWKELKDLSDSKKSKEEPVELSGRESNEAAEKVDQQAKEYLEYMRAKVRMIGIELDDSDGFESKKSETPFDPIKAEDCVSRFDELFSTTSENKLKRIEESWKVFSSDPPYRNSARKHLLRIWREKRVTIWEKNNLDLSFMNHLSSHLRLNEKDNHLGLRKLEDQLFRRIIFFGTKEEGFMLKIYKIIKGDLGEYEGFRRMVTLSKQVGQEIISRNKPNLEKLEMIKSSLFEDSKSGEYEKIFDIFGYYGLNEDLERNQGYYNSARIIPISHPFEFFPLKYPELGTSKSEIYINICGRDEYRSRSSPRIHFTSPEFTEIIKKSNYGKVSKSEELHQSLIEHGLDLNRIMTVILILGLEDNSKFDEIAVDLIHYKSKVLFKMFAPNNYNHLPWDQTAERKWIYRYYKKDYYLKLKSLINRLGDIDIQDTNPSLKAVYSESDIQALQSLDQIDSKSKCMETRKEILDVEFDPPEHVAIILGGFEPTFFDSYVVSNPYQDDADTNKLIVKYVG
ncbi:hypothetical protein KEM48_011245 [Puccinia striiformis f. sp. tritici PST-130]|nr:hypothetical protein KEM48_011245 [Puccinia striiformis f. sp. tritici PST-130]